MDSRLKNIYDLMIYRCTSPKYDKRKYYSERGISVCDEWIKSYNSFEEWALNNGYQDGLTIDRIDINCGYCPDNCRWSTRKEQANNRSSNHFITWNGQTKTIAQWSELIGMSQKTLSERICAGWSIDRVFTEPVHSNFRPKFITYNNETLSIADWSRRLGVGPTVIGNRLARGWSVEKALTTPVKKV